MGYDTTFSSGWGGRGAADKGSKAQKRWVHTTGNMYRGRYVASELSLLSSSWQPAGYIGIISKGRMVRLTTNYRCIAPLDL
jgi:hypothetical protein